MLLPVYNKNRIKKARICKDSRLYRFPRGLVIMTAENPLIGQSIVGRMVYVGVQPGDILPVSGNADNKLGYYEAGNEKVLYLRTETCLSNAKQFWRGLDENLDIMPDALRRQLSQVSGLLAQVGERQVEVTKFCAGANQRVLVVDSEVVENLYSVSLCNPQDGSQE
jgi:hypothetical protein